MTALIALAASCNGMTDGDVSSPGVYILIRNGEVAYVGQSSRSMIRRVGSHYIKFDRVLFFAEPDRERRLALEGALLRRFNPPEATAGPRKGAARDERILRALGIEADPVASAAFCDRQFVQRRAAGLKAAESRARFNRGLSKSLRKKQRARRLLRFRSLLWQAVQPFIAPNLSHTHTVVTDSESVDVNDRVAAQPGITEVA